MKKLQFAIAAIASIAGVSGLVAATQPTRAPLVQVRPAGGSPFVVDLADKGNLWDCTENQPTACYYIDTNGDGTYETPSDTRGDYFEIN